MKQNFTVRQGALDGVEAFVSVARRRRFSPGSRGTLRDDVGHQSGGACIGGAGERARLTEAREQFLSRAKPAFQ